MMERRTSRSSVFVLVVSKAVWQDLEQNRPVVPKHFWPMALCLCKYFYIHVNFSWEQVIVTFNVYEQSSFFMFDSFIIFYYMCFSIDSLTEENFYCYIAKNTRNPNVAKFIKFWCYVISSIFRCYLKEKDQIFQQHTYNLQL